MARITWIECCLDDATVGASLCASEIEVAAQIAHDAVIADRLTAARCERCLEETGEALTLSGPEALCAACLDAEAPEAPA